MADPKPRRHRRGAGVVATLATSPGTHAAYTAAVALVDETLRTANGGRSQARPRRCAKVHIVESELEQHFYAR